MTKMGYPLKYQVGGVHETEKKHNGSDRRVE
jgi:hypothetical protein